MRHANDTSMASLLPALLVLAALGLGACATTGQPPAANEPVSTSRLEVEDAVGFSIVEEGSVPAGIRGRYDEALEALGNDDAPRGIALLEGIVEEAPHLSAPLIDLGVAMRREGKLQAAEQHLKRAVEAAPQHPVAHNELGIVYRRLARFDEARRHYEAALAIYPGYHYARRNLAVLCDLYLVDARCALENYEAYAQIVPGDEQVTMWLADLRLRMNEGATP